jgi:GNAT superfamily N-acetyltransferase
MPTIREAAPADEPALAALLGQLGYPAAPGAVRGRLAGLLGRDDYAVYLAELDGAPCGLGCAHVLPVLHSDAPLALITALVVDEEARGSGVGRALVERLETFARSQHCGRIIVTTASQRAGAHAFYDRLGYDYTGRRYAKLLP